MEDSMFTKNQGGLGIKDISVWNKAKVAKLAWAIENKKDLL